MKKLLGWIVVPVILCWYIKIAGAALLELIKTIF